MFVLVDANNFYASCERVFNPKLHNKPVIILSNNDGCVIARSNEAKKLGIKMGVPAYQIEQEIKKYNIAVFSSNYNLYGDMSMRIVTSVAQFTPEYEIYSIDELFADISGFKHIGFDKYGGKIARTVTRNTGIPVSVGIGQTKTLAKIANKFAKKYRGYKNVCLIDNEEKRKKALQLTCISDVWGIGRQHRKFLEKKGINTAYDFTQQSRSFVRKYMTVTGERLWMELQGTSCIELEIIPANKKQICTSRAFPHSIDNIEEMKEAISYYAAICAEKLRKQNSCAVSLMIFILTNPFRKDLPQYSRSQIINLPVATNSTMEIVHYCLIALKGIYRKGYLYKKAGVILTEIIPDSAIQTHLLDTVDREKHSRIMQIVDKLNSGYSSNLLSLAVQGTNRKWRLKQEKLSPCYTTKLSDIITIK